MRLSTLLIHVLSDDYENIQKNHQRNKQKVYSVCCHDSVFEYIAFCGTFDTHNQLW